MAKRGNPNMRQGAPSINPKGRPRTMVEHRESLSVKMRAKEAKILAVLEGALEDPICKNRIAAATVMLERGWGRAAIVGDMESPLRIDVSIEDEVRLFLEGIVASK